MIGRASNWGLIRKRTYSKLIESQNVNHFHFELLPSEMKNVCSVSLFEKLTIKGKISLIWSPNFAVFVLKNKNVLK